MIVWILAISVVRLFAAEPEAYEFTPSQCQEYLHVSITPDPVQDAKAAQFVAWLTATHPAQQRLFSEDVSLQVKFDLLYLSTGYVLVPADPGLLTRASSAIHYDNRIAFYHPTLMVDGTKSKARKYMRTFSSAATSTDVSGRDFLVTRLNYLTELVSRSLFFLDQVSRSQHQFYLSPADLRATCFTTPHVDHWFSKMQTYVKIEWPAIVQTDELDQWRAILVAMRDVDVRTRAVQVISRNLKTIINARESLCDRLNRCKTSAEFAAEMTSHRSNLVIEDLEFTKLPILASPEPTLALDPPVEKALAEATAIPGFLTEPIRYGDSLEEASLGQLWNDLQETTQYTTEALFRLQPLWTAPVDWRELSRRVEPTIESLESLRRQLSEQRSKTAQVLFEFTKSEATFNQITTWLAGVASFVSSLELDRAKIEALNEDRRDQIGSILEGLPLVTVLLENTSSTIQQRRRFLKAQLNAIHNVNVILASIAYVRLDSLSARAAMESLNEYRTLTETLRKLGDGT